MMKDSTPPSLRITTTAKESAKEVKTLDSTEPANQVGTIRDQPSLTAGMIRESQSKDHANDATFAHEDGLRHDALLRQLGEVASALAYDISRPLAAIANFSEAGLHASGDNEAVKDYLIKIGQRTLEAKETINAAREFCRKHASRRELLDISEIVAQVFGKTLGEATHHDIILHTTTPAARLPRIHADRTQIELVLRNLVANGIDAVRGSNHERMIEVTLGTMSNDQEILVSVRDTGIGIPADIARCMFKPFYSTKMNRLGLGLTVSASIIEDHGGRLWLSSTRAPRGSTFFISLPTCVANMAQK